MFTFERYKIVFRFGELIFLVTHQAPNCDTAGDLKNLQNVVRQLVIKSLRQPVTIGTFTELSMSSSNVDVGCLDPRTNNNAFCIIKVEGLGVSFRKRVCFYSLIYH